MGDSWDCFRFCLDLGEPRNYNQWKYPKLIKQLQDSILNSTWPMHILMDPLYNTYYIIHSKDSTVTMRRNNVTVKFEFGEFCRKCKFVPQKSNKAVAWLTLVVQRLIRFLLLETALLRQYVMCHHKVTRCVSFVSFRLNSARCRQRRALTHKTLPLWLFEEIPKNAKVKVF